MLYISYIRYNKYNYMKSILTILCLCFLLSSCHQSTTTDSSALAVFEARMHDKQYPNMDYAAMLNYPAGYPSISKYKAGMKQAASDLNQSAFRQGSWEVQGPGNLGGRVNTIAIDGANVLLGFTRSGIWKSTDYGLSWYCTSDDLITQSWSDITYHPYDKSIVYAASGDHNISGNAYNGNGIFKSTNGGDSWEAIGLAEAGIISEIKIGTEHPDIIYAATMGIPFIRSTDRGLYKSTDGGTSWSNVLYLNDSTGIIDIAVHPTDDDIVYAASWTRIRSNRTSLITSSDAKVHKTTDGGATWTVLDNGLPVADSISRIGLDLYEQDPDILVASYVHYTEAANCRPGYQLRNVYKTMDAGMSWDTIPSAESNGLPCNIMGGFGWFFGQVRMNPNDHNDITLLGVDMYRTTDNGQLWDIFSPPWWQYSVHADKHELVYEGDDVWLGTDGGAYRADINSQDIEWPSSLHWQDAENIPGNLVYRVGINPHDPNGYYCGLQDNGTTGGNADNIVDWPRIFGGDGFTPAFHPTNPDISYVETQRGNIYLSELGSTTNITGALEGSRNWDMHYIISPHSGDVLYTATDRFYRGLKVGSDVIWEDLSGPLLPNDDSLSFVRETFSHVNNSELNPAILYGATATGLAFRSLDAGGNWDQIFTDLPRRYYSSIKSSPNEESSVYLTIQGYLDFDNTPYVLKSTDYGDTYTSIQGDLPEVAINDVLVLPNQEADDMIFVATEAGVYYTDDAGTNWIRLGDDMPLISVKEIKLDATGTKLVAATYGRSVMTYDLAQVIISSTDVLDPAVSSLQVWPTAASQSITIATTATATDGFIISMAGSVVRPVVIRDGGVINISDLPQGAYILQSQSAASCRFVKL